MKNEAQAVQEKPLPLLERAKAYTSYPATPGGLKDFRDVTYKLLQRSERLGGLMGEISFSELELRKLTAEIKAMSISDPQFGEKKAAAEIVSQKVEKMITEILAVRAEFERLKAIDDRVNRPAGVPFVHKR